MEHSTRTKRSAAIRGVNKRRSSEEKFKKLDKTLKKDMGTSKDKITKKGTPRVEFYGFKFKKELY
tara:strand:+ start:632 stop:826 length:195 start_codon:yes stop_codon:yes gene_type:complete